MNCPNCKRAMVQLFLTEACDYCDYGPPQAKLHKGFIVMRPTDGDPFEEYVFRTKVDAERWRTAAGRESCEIRSVYSLMPFRWHLSTGTLRDLVLADHMFEIFKDHRHEPLSHRAFLGESQLSLEPTAKSIEVEVKG